MGLIGLTLLYIVVSDKAAFRRCCSWRAWRSMNLVDMVDACVFYNLLKCFLDLLFYLTMIS